MDCAFGHLTLGRVIDHVFQISPEAAEARYATSQDGAAARLASVGMTLRPSSPALDQQLTPPGTLSYKPTVSVRRRGRTVDVP